MQQDKHPDYHPVVFRDRTAGYAFLTRSTATSDQTVEWDDGKTYPRPVRAALREHGAGVRRGRRSPSSPSSPREA